MTDTTLRRLRRSVTSLHRTGLLIPAAGMAVIGGSGWAMAAAAAGYPDAALAAGGFGSCDFLQSDFGCGHGFGCACHMLPEPAPHI